ncbi:MAG: hypothetical protein XXXJIFNMEKO3_02703 [Candidatus Erwinia impunctatus]
MDATAGLKYTGLLLEIFEHHAVNWDGGSISGLFAAQFFGIRIFAILASWQVVVAVTLLQVIATVIVDDELQMWCKRSVFGSAPVERDQMQQEKELTAAVKEIG